MTGASKNYFFIHQNMPGQFPHLLKHLTGAGHKAYFITKGVAKDVAGVMKVVYKYEEPKAANPYLQSLESAVVYGQRVARALLHLKGKDVIPDMIIGHSGWGETLFIKDVFPDVPVLSYFELYFRAEGADVNFDPEYKSGPEAGAKLRVRNSINLLSLEGCDRGVSPTWWQWGSYPERYRSKITVQHEGVDTGLIRRPERTTFTLPGGRILSQGQEIVTYVSRNLEPYRGFHIFMRAVAEICRRRPRAQVLIVGGDKVSYGRKAPEGAYRKKALEENDIDASRVHFLGRVPYDTFLNLLYVSSAHVYLTYPFVLSWSMLEAMAAECLVIGSRTPPVEEVIVDGTNGVLVDFFDHMAIADRVVEALEKPDSFKQMRKAARRTVVDRYDLYGVCLPKYLSLIRDVAEGRK